MAKRKKGLIEKETKLDFGARATHVVGDFIQKVLFIWYPAVMKYVKEQWIKLIVLVMSATMTFSLLNYLAPPWAWWLPYIAILLVEGSIPFWQIRELNADAADGDVEDEEKNAQEKLANAMVWTGLTLMVVTMIGGALIEVGDSEVLSKVLKPNAGVTGFMGWSSLIGVFIFGAIQVWADWQYKRLDPMNELMREGRARMRKLDRTNQRAILQGEEKVTKAAVRNIRKEFNKIAPVAGANRARQRMKGVEGNVPAPADVSKKPKDPNKQGNRN
jgi:hypothetical protein